ncbi:MAG: RNA methyltransferase [Bacteroidales bacterium]|nr:RNA methyltransferase [Bacteroidales bacterium]MCF0211247.1 RNA methyltransferase [Bacteroidales bacterium]
MKNEKLSMQQLNRISVEEFKASEKTPIVVVLDNIRSMNNIGSVFRTADAFRLDKLFLCGITATPPHREINKTALGATESVDWEYRESTLECVKELLDKDYKIFALEQTSDSISLEKLTKEDLTDKIAIILGNEVEGVQQEVIDISHSVLEIPQFGTKHSLNVSVSCGIAVWECIKLLKL